MENIQNILKEIYAVDPELKAYEPELVRIIEEIISKRPDTRFDEAFARELRSEVLKRARELKQSQSARPVEAGASFWPAWPKWSYAAAGAALTLLVVLPWAFSQDALRGGRVALDQDEGITKVDGNAFGSLAFLSGGGGRGAGEGLGAGGGEENDMAVQERMAAAPMGLGGDGIGMVMPAPFSFKFEYAGEDLALDESSSAVYRRPQDAAAAGRLSSLIGGLDLGIMNLSALDNLQVGSLNLLQDKEYGLGISYNAREGSFSLYQNWQRWPNPGENCDNEACYQANRLRIDEIPADSVLINIANDFLRGLGVSTANYGEPSVQNNWRQAYDSSEDKSMAWVPEEIQVVYPLILGGQETLEYGGNRHGLSVNVNVRARRGSGLYNLYPYNYESSDYRMATDFSRLVKLAENGGEYPSYDYEGAEQVVLKLGMPERVLMQYHQYDQAKGQSQVLFVPALKFPITNRDEVKTHYWQDAVLIPLAEEIVSEWEKRHQDAPDMPMPMPRPVEPLPITIMDGDTPASSDAGPGFVPGNEGDSGSGFDPDSGDSGEVMIMPFIGEDNN